MTDVARLMDSVTTDEAYKPVPYKDSLGLWTFGIGRCLETNPLTGAEWKQLLDNGWINASVGKVGAQWLAACELHAVESLLNRYSWFSQIGDVRQNAFIEMAYQLGIAKFARFTQMLAAANTGDWQGVYEQALSSLWAKQTPDRAKMIARMLLKGEWP